ncbi:uncharacterized protein [Drosophila tropicalis]|uniref:uncharacterized protein n=1 Tax=Drosophila tropicalis TaxID=46794 RepID=UPI0035AC2840
MPENALPEATRAALSGSTFGQRREDIFRRLQQSAQQISKNYAGFGKEFATERDDTVQDFCEALEDMLGYGLRQTINVAMTAASIFQNMQEIVTGGMGVVVGGGTGETTFWDFCQQHLTPHEKQRYMELKQIWTKTGRGRAFLRSTLNEKRLQSHVLTWLSDEEQLNRYYTPWSLLLNEEAAKKLPEILDSLQNVVFALQVDTTELNAPRRTTGAPVVREEPIIFAPQPVPVAVKRRQERPVERPIEGASSTEDLLGALSPKEALEVQQIISNQAVDQKLTIPDKSDPNCPPCDPIGPELEFLKTPLPDVYAETEAYEDRSDTSSQWSKSSSSANVLTSQQSALDDQLHRLTERCALLETRVAELNLQNRQLIRRLTKQFEESGIDPNSSFCSNFLITIPQVKLTKTHYTYEIHITMRQRLEHWTLFRRYSEFNKLHKSLLRTHPSVHAVEFPPKKHFGNMKLVFVEERRQQLQIYLLNLVETLPQVESCKSKEELQKCFPFFRES